MRQQREANEAAEEKEAYTRPATGKGRKQLLQNNAPSVRFRLRNITEFGRSVNPEMQVTLDTSFEVALQLNDTAADADGDGLGAVGGAQFFHNVFDVDLDGLLGNEQFVRNIPVLISPRYLS